MIGWRGLEVVLVDRHKQRLRSVDRLNVSRAGASVMHIARTESAADGSLGIRSQGKADARCKVVQVRVDEGMAVDAAACCNRCEVRARAPGVVVIIVWVMGSKLETKLFCSE